MISLGLRLAAGTYLLGLATWFGLHELVGDATSWLFLLNALAIYLFVPLPLALLVSVLRRDVPLIGGSLAGFALFALLWGGLFWPNGGQEPEGPVLTVMTYNVLGSNPDTEGVVEALIASHADLIGLQELNPVVAAAIERDLAVEYPYQTLAPKADTTGVGIISRLPFRSLKPDLEDPDWIGQPIAVEVDFAGTAFTFVSAHSASRSKRLVARERQARLLSDYVGSLKGPVILAGDFNAQDLNDSYAIVTEHLNDTWREAGTGLGNTFPGASRAVSPGSKRPNVLGIDLPQWLIRIDYVFCTDDWQALDARIGPWEGYSDHRPVIAEVALRRKGASGS